MAAATDGIQEKSRREEGGDDAPPPPPPDAAFRRRVMDQWRCPLTLRVMVDPVLASDSACYERSALARRAGGRDAIPSPIGADADVSMVGLRDNVALRRSIAAIVEECGVKLLGREECADYWLREGRRLSAAGAPSDATLCWERAVGLCGEARRAGGESDEVLVATEIEAVSEIAVSAARGALSRGDGPPGDEISGAIRGIEAARDEIAWILNGAPPSSEAVEKAMGDLSRVHGAALERAGDHALALCAYAKGAELGNADAAEAAECLSRSYAGEWPPRENIKRALAHPLAGGIQVILKRVHPDLELSLPCCAVLLDLMTLLPRLVSGLIRPGQFGSSVQDEAESKHALSPSLRACDEKMIRGAIQFLLPSGLAKRAVSEGTKTVNILMCKMPGNFKSHEQERAWMTSSSAGAALSCTFLRFPVLPVCLALESEVQGNVFVDMKAATFLTAVMEYICAKLLEMSGNEARDEKTSRITPRHVNLAVHSDAELRDLWPGSRVIVVGGGGSLVTLPGDFSRTHDVGGKNASSSPDNGNDEKDSSNFIVDPLAQRKEGLADDPFFPGLCPSDASAFVSDYSIRRSVARAGFICIDGQAIEEVKNVVKGYLESLIVSIFKPWQWSNRKSVHVQSADLATAPKIPHCAGLVVTEFGGKRTHELGGPMMRAESCQRAESEPVGSFAAALRDFSRACAESEAKNMWEWSALGEYFADHFVSLLALDAKGKELLPFGGALDLAPSLLGERGGDARGEVFLDEAVALVLEAERRRQEIRFRGAFSESDDCREIARRLPPFLGHVVGAQRDEMHYVPAMLALPPTVQYADTAMLFERLRVILQQESDDRSILFERVNEILQEGKVHGCNDIKRKLTQCLDIAATATEEEKRSAGTTTIARRASQSALWVEQRRQDTLFHQGFFRWLVLSIQSRHKLNVTWAEDAFALLQETTEAYVVGLLRNAGQLSVHSNRSCISREDIQLVDRMFAEKMF